MKKLQNQLFLRRWPAAFLLAFFTFFSTEKSRAQDIIDRPPDYGKIAIRIPHCPEHRPSGRAFTIETTVLENGASVVNPIFTSEKGDAALFIVRGKLTYWFRAQGKKGLETGIFETETAPFALRQRHLIRLVHGEKDVAFSIDERPVAGVWKQRADPSKIRLRRWAWVVGGSSAGEFFDGYVQNFRFFDGDSRDFEGLENDDARDSAAARKLRFDFELDDFSPREGDSASVALRSHFGEKGPCSRAEIVLKTGVQLLSLSSAQKYAAGSGDDLAEADSPSPEERRERLQLAFWSTTTIVFALFLMVVLTARMPSHQPWARSKMDGKIMLEELPPELAGLAEREEIDFVLRNRLPVPFWRVAKTALFSFVAVAAMSAFWLRALQNALSDDPKAVSNGIFWLLALGAGTFFLVRFLLWNEGVTFAALFEGRSFCIGTADRLVLFEPSRGLFRSIFWEQVRDARLSLDGRAIQLELRTVATQDGSTKPELIFLNDLSKKGKGLVGFINWRMEQSPIPPSSSDAILNFGSEEAFFYENRAFSNLFVYRHVLFGAEAAANGRPFLILRSRVETARVEPYDRPRSGWIVVAGLKNGARQPLAFFENLEEARTVAAFLNR